eukprot:GHUV01005114.1.p1 GENE.GHUV01005114.1~~GHUV01005114.1.p1  ORF type:complete len:650 (+),score=247.40 GHUV01005114.1:207-2156(+)
MEDDEQLRQALQESLKTARLEDERRESETVVPTAPALPGSGPTAVLDSAQPVSEFERQRREAIERQKARWHQLHAQPVPEHTAPQYQQPSSNSQSSGGSLYPSVPGFEAPAGPGDAGNLYPSIPGYSTGSDSGVPEDSMLYEQQVQPAADPYLEELRRKQQQEEEDRRLAMQLAEQYASEDSEDEHAHSDGSAAAGAAGPAFDSRPYPSSSDDGDWQQVNRTASLQQPGTATGAGATGPRDSAGVGGGSSSRPSSQAAAAAGSAAGGLLGAGLSALLAMAASAATRSAQQQQQQREESSAHASTSDGQQHASSSSTGGSRQQHNPADVSGAAATATGGESSSSSGSGVQGLLGMAANALWNYMRGRNSSSSSSTATASSSSSGRYQQQQQGGGGDQEVLMLQQLMRQLMAGGPPNYQQAGSSSRDRGSGQGTGGFRVVNLPGGGFAATYSSSSGNGSRQYQSSSAAAADGRFGPYMDPTEDLITQLLLAGARSARSNRSQGLDGHEPGFTHYDPAAGYSRFEPSDQIFGPGFMGPGFRQVPDQGLEALIGALFGGQGQGIGNMRYEDLVNLDNVNVSTPEDVLSQLPRSKYVEGRKPGDSDTCVICQTQYNPGDSLIHLPCLHAFHEECITPWLQGHSKKCPVCKTDVC